MAHSYQRSLEEELTNDWAEGVHPHDAQRYMDTYTRSFDARQEFQMEYRLKRRDGEYRWMLDHGVPRFVSADGFDGYIGSCVDITERKLAEQNIQKINEELEARVAERTTELKRLNEELEAFSYSVSHDLRAPLRVMNGLSQIMIEDHGTHLPEEIQKRLKMIRGSARKMSRLVDDLLALFRLVRMPLQECEVDTAELVREALVELGAGTNGRRVNITIGNLPPCRGAPTLLKQVFVNLLSNALKFTQSREEAVIEVGYYVRDNGVGFEMRHADRLFRVFERLHSDEEFEGNGIGLALTHRIIRRHHGEIWAESTLDKGSTFSFTIGIKPQR